MNEENFKEMDLLIETKLNEELKHHRTRVKIKRFPYESKTFRAGFTLDGFNDINEKTFELVFSGEDWQIWPQTEFFISATGISMMMYMLSYSLKPIYKKYETSVEEYLNFKPKSISLKEAIKKEDK